MGRSGSSIFPPNSTGGILLRLNGSRKGFRTYLVSFANVRSGLLLYRLPEAGMEDSIGKMFGRSFGRRLVVLKMWKSSSTSQPKDIKAWLSDRARPPHSRAGRRGDYFEIRPDAMFEMTRPD